MAANDHLQIKQKQLKNKKRTREKVRFFYA